MTIRPCGPETGAGVGAPAVTLDWQPGRVVVSGELDAYTAPGFVASFTEGVEGFTGGCLALDCSSLQFVDASGLSSLLIAARHARSAGLGFHLAERGQCLGRLMQLCSLREL